MALRIFGLSGVASMAMAAAVSAQTLPAPEETESSLQFDSICGATVLQTSRDIDELWSLVTDTADSLSEEFIEEDIYGYRQLRELMQNHWSGDISIRNQLIENMGAVCDPDPTWSDDKALEYTLLDQCVTAINNEAERITTNIDLFENADPMDSVYLDIAARTLIQTFAESYDLLYEGCGEREPPENEDATIIEDDFIPN